jgi:hypothetical protein
MADEHQIDLRAAVNAIFNEPPFAPPEIRLDLREGWRHGAAKRVRCSLGER